MAQINSLISGVAGTTLFSGLPDPGNLSNSIYPRALVKFRSSTGIALKPAGDTQTIEWRLSLPKNFAYVHCQTSMTVQSAAEATADDFDNIGNGFVEGVAGDPDTQSVIELLSNGASLVNGQAGQQKSWALRYAPATVVYNTKGSSPRLRFYISDSDGVNAAAARLFYGSSTWFQYDINQVTNVIVNAAQPVRLC